MKVVLLFGICLVLLTLIFFIWRFIYKVILKEGDETVKEEIERIESAQKDKSYKDYKNHRA